MFFFSVTSKATTALPSPCDASPSAAQPTKRARTRGTVPALPCLSTVHPLSRLPFPWPPDSHSLTVSPFPVSACPHSPASSSSPTLFVVCRQSRKPEEPQNIAESGLLTKQPHRLVLSFLFFRSSRSSTTTEPTARYFDSRSRFVYFARPTSPSPTTPTTFVPSDFLW